jgi:chromate reductase
MVRSVVGLSGSLRQHSYNTRLLEEAVRLAPAGLAIERYTGLGDVPPFNEDDETPDGGPAPVQRLRAAVRQADAVLVSTPEYNQSIPGVLKNIIDWISRPGPDEVLDRKPAAIIGTTTGPWGTRYAQKELRHVLTVTGALVLPAPMLFVPDAKNALSGVTIDASSATDRRLREFLSAFGDWIEVFSSTETDPRGATAPFGVSQ